MTARGRTPDWRPRLRAAGLALPLLAFIAVTFVAPLTTMLSRSVHDAVVADALPETLALLEGWDGEGVPGEDVFAAAALGPAAGKAVVVGGAPLGSRTRRRILRHGARDSIDGRCFRHGVLLG